MNRKQQAFVCEMLRHGNKAEAYKAAYKPQSDDPRSIESASGRLLKIAEIAEAIQTIQDRIYAEVQVELKACKQHEALTRQRKREILAQMAEGQWIMQPPPDNIKGKPTVVLVPTLKERLRAIDMDNRMTGAYSIEERAEIENEEKHNKTQRSGTVEKEVVSGNKQAQQEIYVPLPVADKKKPFVMPVIKSRDPLLNGPVIGNPDAIVPALPLRGTCGSCMQERGVSIPYESKPAWLQTIRV